MSRQVSRVIHVGNGRDGRRELRDGTEPEVVMRERPSRTAELIAIAHRMNAMLASGEVSSQTALAALAHVTPARVTQILHMLDLSPAVQELVLVGQIDMDERALLTIAMISAWDEQRGHEKSANR